MGAVAFPHACCACPMLSSSYPTQIRGESCALHLVLVSHQWLRVPIVCPPPEYVFQWRPARRVRVGDVDSSFVCAEGTQRVNVSTRRACPPHETHSPALPRKHDGTDTHTLITCHLFGPINVLQIRRDQRRSSWHRWRGNYDGTRRRWIVRHGWGWELFVKGRGKPWRGAR